MTQFQILVFNVIDFNSSPGHRNRRSFKNLVIKTSSDIDTIGSNNFRKNWYPGDFRFTKYEFGVQIWRPNNVYREVQIKLLFYNKNQLNILRSRHWKFLIICATNYYNISEDSFIDI